MLFSDDRVARFLNTHFEPAWQSVRPVPLVTIDFGEGRVLTRTLHGNVLTSVCTPDGLVLDSLPGIYEPKTYLDQLDQLRLLAKATAARPAKARAELVKDYHTGQAKALKKGLPPQRFVELVGAAYVRKSQIEDPVEQILLVAGEPRKAAKPDAGGGKSAGPAGWKALAEDTRINETARRRLIHELLAREGLPAPARVTRPIYKQVLHADLDDPYLGLGKVLFEDYPFAREDEAR